MKRQVLTILQDAVLSALPQLHRIGNELVVLPLADFLRGFSFEPSSRGGGMYIWTLVQPLYIPSDSITYDFARRLGGGTHLWDPADLSGLTARVRSEGASYYEGFTSPDRFLHWSSLADEDDESMLEARAYTLVRAGNFKDGVCALRAFASLMPKEHVSEHDIARRDNAVRLAELGASSPQAAIHQLDQWRAATIAALGLSDVGSD